MAECMRNLGFAHGNVSRLRECESEWQDALCVLRDRAGIGSYDSSVIGATMSKRTNGRSMHLVLARGTEDVG